MATILHIDDDLLILKAIRSHLTRLGHTVISSDVARDAENLFAEHQPDLAILDVAMPERSGLEIFDAIKEKQSLVPVLFCTGHAESFNMDCEDKIRRWTEGFADGMTDIIYKPFTLQDLADKVDSLISMGSEMS